MAVNNRVYYPIHAVGFAKLGTEIADITGFRAAKGVQSLGFNTTFNLEQVFQLGQLSIYENIENIPDIELTVEKVVDGYALLEHLATPTATAASLGGRYNDNRAMVAISYYSIVQDAASGQPLANVIMSGMYVSQMNWTLPVEGNVTESITLVGNDKLWSTVPSGTTWTSETQFDNAEAPVAGGSGGVQRRENIDMDTSFWPLSIPGISGIAGSGVNQTLGNGQFAAHIQNVTISVNLGREELLELGRRGPYFRYAQFPTEVTCSIDVTANEDGDAVDAREESENLINEKILINLDQGVVIDLGTTNKLASVNTTGGDAAGGNVTTTYNYSNFNDLTVTSTHNDPAGL